MQRWVPGLGTVEGVSSTELPNIEQYNGIPYGSIPARFRQAKLVETWPDNRWDGTKYGPICPFPRMVIGHGLTQVRLPPQHDYDMDEFKCLNLNVTCPRGSKPDSGWPVAVWIHGGGNCVGMGSDPGYNGGPLVNFSVEKGIPIIVVTINYRLGAFGFLASEELKKDNAEAGDHGFGNYGLRDQLVAYDWVKKNIEAFGGDSNRITGVGESAGSIDTHTTMLSELFQEKIPFTQAILQSGVSSRNVRTLQQQQVDFDLIATYVNIQPSTSVAETLQALRDVPAEDLVKAYIALGAPVQAWQATADGYFLKTPFKASSLSSVTYPASIKRILIGDCTAEGLIFAPQVKAMKLDFEKVHALAVKELGEEASQEVMQAYGISEEQSPEQLHSSVIKIVTDVAWSQPIEAVARSFSNGNVFYYHMSEVNPFDGPNKGTAHHGVDLLYIFLTYQAHLPVHLAKLAETVAGHWLSFINNKQPWALYNQKDDGSSTLMMFGPEGASREVPESTKLAYKTLQLCKKLLDNIRRFEEALYRETTS